MAQVVSMKTDKLTKFIVRCLLVLGSCGVGQAYAHCNISLEANPPFPDTIASTQVVGTIIYKGNLTWRFSSCYAFSSSGFIWLAAGVPQPTPVWGVSGLTVEGGMPSLANLVNTSLAYVPSFLENQGVYGFNGSYGNYWNMNEALVPSTAFDITQTITIKASATTISGKFPDPSRGGVLMDRKYLPEYLQNRCMTAPWIAPIIFSDCLVWGTGVAGYLNRVGEPIITLTPTVPRIVSGSASSDQNCRPVLRSSITIPNLKTP
jgi:hypothetical protein